MRRIAVVLAGLALVAACGSTAGTTAPEAPLTSTTATTAPSDTTAPAVTTVPVTSVPTATTVPATTVPTVTTIVTSVPPPVDLPAVLVVDDEGASVWDGGSTTLLWSGAAQVAFPDGAGGAIVGLTQDRYFQWDRSGERLVPTPPSRDYSVLAVTASGQVTGLVPESPDAIDRLVQVADVGGRRVLVLYRTVAGPPCCDNPDVDPRAVETSVVTHLVLRDLLGGAEDYLGIVGDFESSHYRLRFAGDTVAISSEPYGGGIGGVGWLPLSAFPPAEPWPEGPWNWLAETCFDSGCFTHGPVAACDAAEDCAGYVTEPALAPNASAIAFVEVMEQYSREGSAQQHPDVVVVEIPSGTERLRVTLDQIEPGTNTWPTCIDFDGSRVVVSFSAPGGGPTARTFLVGSDGSIDLLPVTGMARFWASGPIGS